MLLSANQEAAARALVTFLLYQSGHAQREALGFPDDVAAAIAGHALDRPHAAESIKDELSRLYDRRRDGHARSVEEEMKHQQHVLAARIVIERELGATPDQSLAATSIMTDEELAEVAALTTEPNCRDQVVAINERSAQRIMAAQPTVGQDFEDVDAAAAMEEQLAAATAQTLADAEQKTVEESVPAEGVAAPAAPTGDAAGESPLPTNP